MSLNETELDFTMNQYRDQIIATWGNINDQQIFQR